MPLMVNSGPKGVKGWVPASVPRGGFWSKSSKMARNEPTNASKGYSGPPESIPMVSRTFDFRRIFGRFEPGSLSTFFHNPTSKNRKSPLPRGSPGGSKGGVWPQWARTPHVQRRAGGNMLGMSRLGRFRHPQTDSETLKT